MGGSTYVLVAAHRVCACRLPCCIATAMDRPTAKHELGKTRGRTAETQARGMDSTSTTVPPVHGLSTGTTKNNKKGLAAAAIRLRSAAQEVPPSPENSDTSGIFIDEPMDEAQERAVFSCDGAAAGAVDVHDSYIGPTPEPGSVLAAALMDARTQESGQVERLQLSNSTGRV